MRFNLSQDLTINNRFTISLPGETEEYFGSCNEIGAESSSCNSGWYALTEKAALTWEGEIKTIDGIVCRRVI